MSVYMGWSCARLGLFMCGCITVFPVIKLQHWVILLHCMTDTDIEITANNGGSFTTSYSLLYPSIWLYHYNIHLQLQIYEKNNRCYPGCQWGRRKCQDLCVWSRWRAPRHPLHGCQSPSHLSVSSQRNRARWWSLLDLVNRQYIMIQCNIRHVPWEGS